MDKLIKENRRLEKELDEAKRKWRGAELDHVEQMVKSRRLREALEQIQRLNAQFLDDNPDSASMIIDSIANESLAETAGKYQVELVEGRAAEPYRLNGGLHTEGFSGGMPENEQEPERCPTCGSEYHTRQDRYNDGEWARSESYGCPNHCDQLSKPTISTESRDSGRPINLEEGES